MRKGIKGAKHFELGLRFENASLDQWFTSHNTKQSVFGWLHDPKNFIVFVGNPGVGKTYFCAAVLNYLFDVGEEVFFTTGRHLFRDIQEDISRCGSQDQKIQIMCDNKFLIVDDVGAGRTTDWQIDRLTELVDLRYNSMQPTIITSNLDFKKMESELGSRITSRLMAKENLCIELWEKDRRL